MNKFVKGLLVAGVALSIGGAGFTAVTTQAHAASVQSADTTAKINALIQEKQEVINKKKVSRNSLEQKALGIRLGEIEREIQALKNGSSAGGSTGSTTTPSTPANDTAAKINALIQEKQELINKKKVSTNWQEQQALGIRIGEIEREIQALKSGSSTGSSTTPSTPVEDNAAKIAALIQEKQGLVNKKKVSRDKNEQKELGKQIDAIEKEIKQLKKNK